MDVSVYHVFAEEKLGVSFSNIELLITAFTHRSYLNEHKKTVTEHNERLEFLGDAVLELVVTEYLYNTYPDPEGVLTNWRSSLVRTESIGAAAVRCGFEPLLRLSRGESGALTVHELKYLPTALKLSLVHYTLIKAMRQLSNLLPPVS